MHGAGLIQRSNNRIGRTCKDGLCRPLRELVRVILQLGREYRTTLRTKPPIHRTACHVRCTGAVAKR
jgi:hypothetical protein